SATVSYSFTNGFDYVQRAAIQSDGKIVVVGNGTNSGTNYDFSAIRLKLDGSLDTSFILGGGKLGTVIFDSGNGYDNARDVVIQPDGKIVLAGYGAASQPDFCVIRLNADGSLDTAFNPSGEHPGYISVPV